MLCIIFPRIVDHTRHTRAHTRTHTHTHTVVAQPRGTHFLRLTQKLRRKRQSRGKQIKKKKESSKESALPFTKRERYGDIYTLHGKREEKKERERERENKKKERRKSASHEYRIANSTDFNESINVELGGLLSIGL